MGVPSDMHIETNMRESQNTKNEYINIDKIMGMNMHIIQTVKFSNNMQHFNVQCYHISRRFELGILYGNTSQYLIFRTDVLYQYNIFFFTLLGYFNPYYRLYCKLKSH